MIGTGMTLFLMLPGKRNVSLSIGDREVKKDESCKLCFIED